MDFNFPVFQLNCQKRQQSALVLQDVTNPLPTFIAFLQEPYTHAGGARCLNRRHNIISTIDASPRAIIYCHRNAFIWPVASLCTRDVSVAIWDTRTRHGCVLIVSWYWDSSESRFPPHLTSVMEFAAEKKYPVWFSADCNAHSPLWGSSELNARGRKLEQFLFARNLSVLNKGSRPTSQEVTNPL